MSKHDRLCLLQVGEAGADALDVLLGLVHQRLLQAQHFNGQGAHVITQEQPQVVGGLVVARTTGAQLATEGAKAFGQQAFDEGVDVFVVQGRGDAAGAEVSADTFQGVEHGLGFLLAQQSGALQFPGMGLGAGEVVRGEPEVALRATGQGRQGFARAAFEASTPETVGGLRHCCFPRR
ncbi:hypothetical protein D3C87_461700 [compost metagenome]